MKRTKKVILEIIGEYNELINEREQIHEQIKQIREKLGLNATETKNLEEMCQELDRIEALEEKYKEIYNRGKEDITTLSENELLTFNRMQEIRNLAEKSNRITIKLLAIRQGLMNIADRNNSVLKGAIKEKYISAEEFIEHSTASRVVDFITVYNRTSFERAKPIPEMTNDDVRELVVRRDENHIQDSSLHPVLQVFVETLREVNEKTGFNSGKSEPVSMAFAEDEKTGGILISSQPAKKLTTRDLAEADKKLALTDGEVKGIPGFLARTFPSLANVITKIFNKGNGER